MYTFFNCFSLFLYNKRKNDSVISNTYKKSEKGGKVFLQTFGCTPNQNLFEIHNTCVEKTSLGLTANCHC